MIFVGSHSDRTGERHAHVAIPAFIGALGVLLSAYSHNSVTALATLSLLFFVNCFNILHQVAS